VTKLLLTLLAIAAAAAAAIVGNLALLRYASSSSNDPVGKLSPHLVLPAAPARVLPPVNRPPDNEGADD
jgi:hypothetical protein